MSQVSQQPVEDYDAVVVGARCAGAPTAMLLARRGRRVLLVDSAAFPSDHLSTHLIHPAGVVRLRDWGLLEELAHSGCPAMSEMTLDFGPIVLRGRPVALDGVQTHYAPRRLVLDDLLVRSAAAAGAHVRQRTRVVDLIWQDGRVAGVRLRDRGGQLADVRTRLVVGADGVHSTVARLVEAPVEHAHPPVSCAYYGYWHGARTPGMTLFARPGGMVAEMQTNGGATVVYVSWPQARFAEVRADLDSAFMAQVEAIAPSLAARLRAATRREPLRGSGTLHNFLRRSAGPGWALAGDAAAHKDPYLACGISDALRDAQLLADAAHAGLDDDLDDALGRYHDSRTAALRPMYELNLALASLEPPPPELAEHLAALADDPTGTARFLGAISGTVPLAEALPRTQAAAPV
jgi:2-polyprenyl-6-methoxyphenol hydroxylase-like FAD-dependent oxidoreductase